MHRRNWIKATSLGIGAFGLPALYLTSCGGARNDEVSFFDSMVVANDEIVVELLAKQNNQPEDFNYGGFPDTYNIHYHGSATGSVQRFTIAYLHEQSKYYQSPKMIVAMEKATDFLLRIQHEDGTIDLLSTNFHSTPDVAFSVEPMALCYAVLSKNSFDVLEPVLEKIKTFLVSAGAALSTGGIHTPNHRWVVCMALSRIHHLFPHPKYVARVEEWLAEKIDIDPDGQFTERSTGVYSPLTDRCLITVARLLDKSELYEPARKNLDMSLYFAHPNGEIATEASRRQDQYAARNFQPYYYPYLFMAHHDGNPTFGAMAKWIERTVPIRSLSHYLIYFLEDLTLLEDPAMAGLPTDYVKHFPHSEMVRIRRGNLDASILAKNSAFFTLQKGSAVLQAVRMASAFFGKGQLVAEALDVNDGKYVLSQKWEGPYYQPYPVDSLSGDGVWENMPRENRPQSEVQYLEAKVTISENGGGFILDIDLTGTERIPVAVELAFRKGGQFKGVKKLTQVKDSFLLDGAVGEYRLNQDVIRFEGFRSEHEWTQLRGAAPKINADSVYLTGYTPFSNQIRIS